MKGGIHTKKRNPALTAILSFFIPGLGQIYNGQIGKGILILFTGWLIIPWIYGIFDAYAVAEKINKGEITPTSGGCAAIAIFIIAILIAVSMVGCLTMIAIPNFISARETAQASVCVNNLRQIEQAKVQWAIDNYPSRDAIPVWTDLTPSYIRWKPTCPAGGTYTIGSLDSPATCTIGDNGTVRTSDDHILK